VCSIRPDIVEDAKVRIVGNGPVCIMIEDCVRRLLSHDVDGELDGTIDRKIDLFWDELTHFDVSQYSVRYEYLLWARPAKARR